MIPIFHIRHINQTQINILKLKFHINKLLKKRKARLQAELIPPETVLLFLIIMAK